MKSLAYFLGLTGLGVYASRSSDSYSVKSAERVIEMLGSVVKTTVRVTATNTRDVDNDSFYFPLSQIVSGRVNFIKAASKDRTAQLPVQWVEKTTTGNIYKVLLSTPLKPGESVEFDYMYFQGQALDPFPLHSAVVTRENHTPRYSYVDTEYTASIYPLEVERSFVGGFTAISDVLSSSTRTGGISVKEFGEKFVADVTNSESPNGRIPGVDLPNQPLFIHVEHLTPQPRFRTFTKEVAVSLWGSISYDEKYELKNDAPEPENEFSRTELIQIQRAITRDPTLKSKYHTIFEMDGYLPLDAVDIQYFDRIGNVSSSWAARRPPTHTELQLSPRYPVLGGWSADFEITYNTPTSNVLHANPTADKASNAWIFSLPLANSFVGVQANTHVLSVSLPPSAKNIKIAFPIDESFFEVTQSTTWGWLDVFTPRPQITIASKTPLHIPFIDLNATIQIHFEASPVPEILRPVLTLCFYAVLLFFSWIVLGRSKAAFAPSSLPCPLDPTKSILEGDVDTIHNQRRLSRAKAAHHLTELARLADILVEELPHFVSTPNVLNDLVTAFVDRASTLATSTRATLERGNSFTSQEVDALVGLFEAYAKELAISAVALVNFNQERAASKATEAISEGGKKGSKTASTDAARKKLPDGLCAAVTGISLCAPRTSLVEVQCLEAFGVILSQMEKAALKIEAEVTNDPGSKSLGAMTD